MVLAIDGSHAEVDVRNGFPGAEASYMTIACVGLDVARMRQLDANRPVDPRQFRETHSVGSAECALPGSNVVFGSEPSAQASLRRALHEVLAAERPFTDGETLLGTYEALLAHRPEEPHAQRCPYDDCLGEPQEYSRGVGQYHCRCSRQRALYSTDALRVHEGMLEFGKNGALFAEIMQVMERLYLVNILRSLEVRGWLSSLRRLAVVLDGPLAVFGHPAWLSQAIYRELVRINDVARAANAGQDMLVIGVEKSGAFATHLAELDTSVGSTASGLATQSAGLLDDPYIKRCIVPSESRKPYGLDTYFGRKLFYKTRTGALIVATLPFLSEAHRDSSRADPTQYPRLADALDLLDALFSSRYPNALAPIVAAHAEAAIPLNLGQRILERLAREAMGRGDT